MSPLSSTLPQSSPDVQPSQAKFTPGPWRQMGSRDLDGLRIVAGFGNGVVAYIESTLGYAAADEANAHLIAAAPEMYAALKALVEYIGDAYDNTDAPIGSKIMPPARAALAKAEGGAR